jgi:hypothetical protein
MIAAAFDMPASDLTGDSVQQVVYSAMTSNNATWKNQVLQGQAVTNNEIMDSLAQYGIGSPYAATMVGEEAAAAIHQFLGSVSNKQGSSLGAQAREDLGIPNWIPPDGVSTFEELEAQIEKWDQKLQQIGDDSQLANVDLQNMLQKQQQTLQAMSNVSKSLHDGAMAVIRKIGG